MRGLRFDCRVVISTIAILLVCLFFPIASGAANEQSGGAAEIALPEPLTQPEVRDLVSRLSDDQVRTLLISQLDKVAAAETVSDSDLSFEESLASLHRRAIGLWVAIPQLPHLWSFFAEKLTEGQPATNVWWFLLSLAGMFVGAGIFEWLFRRLFTRLGQLAHGGKIETTFDRVCVAGLRMIIDLVAIGVFAIASILIFFAVNTDSEPLRAAISAVFWIVIPVRMIIAVARALTSPDNPSLRLLPLDDQTAQWGFQRTVAVGTIIVIARQLIGLLIAYQVPEEPQIAVRAILLFSLLGVILFLIWRDRQIVATMILSDDSNESETISPTRELLATNWHVLASCYVLGFFLFGFVGMLVTGERHGNPVIISLFLLPAVPIIDWLARIGIRRLCEGSSQKPSEDAALEATMANEAVTNLDASQSKKEHASQTPPESAGQSFEPVLIRNMRVILGLLVILFLAGVWGLDLHNVAAAGMSERVADALFEIVVTLILAWAVWGFIRTAITYHAPQEGIDVDQMIEGEAGGTGLSRAQTLLPLFRKFILIVLIVIVTLVILSSLGVSIGPLIAGAGVIGLAIGFGAQTLVKDIISGAFFLADDAFRLGEYIDVGIAKGMVEKISVRSFRLRHHNGPINTIPFGEVQKVMNYSRDWVMMKLELRVPSDTDLEKMRKVVKKVGQQMMEEPEFSANLLQPLKSQGVNRMDDDGAFVIRVKFMCKPGEQFVLRREVFRRVQEAFAENGIKFAPKRVMVDAGPGVSKEQVAAAAIAVENPPGSKPH